MKKSLISTVSRTTIFTRDISRALGFWRDLMGLSEMIDVTIPNPGASKILGSPCTAIRIVVLSADGGTVGNIGLAEVFGAVPEIADQPMSLRVRFGEACIVIPTKRLDQLLDAMRKAGTTIISEPTKLDLPIKDEVWEMFIRDPDGTLVNLSHHGPWK